MANNTLFRSLVGALVPAANARNEEAAPAYALPPRHCLAQYAATGCLNATFYATADEQLERVVALCDAVTPEFLAKTALYARERGHMKDMPAVLLAILSRRDPALMDRVFDRVVDTPRMLRTFVQVVRSGATGRKSLGSAPRRAVRRWLAAHDDDSVFVASVGNTPSLADVIKMVHPRPANPTREALYGHLIGREVRREMLPALVRQYEEFKAGNRAVVPDVPFQMLTALDLAPRDWADIARHASWQMTRMNLNTYARHGVFDRSDMAEIVASRLRDRRQIADARAFPYQLLVAYRSAEPAVPRVVTDALEAAMETAIANVPALNCQVVVCPDVSGSMCSPVTGRRRGATTVVRCVDVAGLMAAAMLRRNPRAEVLPFDSSVVNLRLSPNDSVMTNAERLASIGGGGTSVSAPLRLLNDHRAKADLVVVVSDNESWVDAGAGRGTATLREWNRFRARNPRARLVLLDIQPYPTTQAVEREDILNVGGFSDYVFEVVAEFAAGRLTGEHWVQTIDAMKV